jgi:hypothetical protein
VSLPAGDPRSSSTRTLLHHINIRQPPEIAVTDPDLKVPVNFRYVSSVFLNDEERVPGAAGAARIAHDGTLSGQGPIYRFRGDTYAVRVHANFESSLRLNAIVVSCGFALFPGADGAFHRLRCCIGPE